MRANLRVTKTSLRGSSFVATSAPKRFAGIRRPRPLTQRAVHSIVSPNTFSWLKTDASRAGNVIGKFTGASRSAGPFSFFQVSQIFAFMRSEERRVGKVV